MRTYIVTLRRSLISLAQPIKGQGLTEYALILLLVATLIVGSLQLFSDGLIDAYADILAAFP